MTNITIGYKYKMQWIFGTSIEQQTKIRKIVNAIGARSLTVVNFRNENGLTITNYNDFVSYTTGEAEKQLTKHILKMLKLYPSITAIELIRR